MFEPLISFKKINLSAKWNENKGHSLIAWSYFFLKQKDRMDNTLT